MAGGILAVTLVALLLAAPLSANNTTSSGDEEEEIDEEPGIVEIAFSFDTTGSMYPVINQVRDVVADMIQRLQSDIPGIRIAVFAHGDWQDAKKTYATKWVDFSTDVDQLQDFVRNVERTGGGDLPEAYELVLHQVSRELSWTPGSRRSLIMIGDNVPHEKDYHANVKNIDWRQEADFLNAMGVRIYAIRALDYDAERFYRTIARKTGGFYLRLQDFSSIIKFIMAISYREHGLEYLEAYEKEVRKQGMTEELENLFRTLKQSPVRRSARSQLDPTRSPSTRSTTLIAPTEPPTELPIERNTEIRTLHIESSISYRFASTSVTSVVANNLNRSSEAIFNMVLPKEAFIFNFTMIIDDVAYVGDVQEKEAARKTYEAARERGESAGHVAAAPRNTAKFRVSVNVAALSQVTFVLHYQELLQRRLGKYSHVIHIDPGQVVNDFQVVVNVFESRELTYLHVPGLRSDLLNDIESQLENRLAVVTRLGPNTARVVYRPTADQQKERASYGLRGQLVVEYDVQRSKDAGEVQIYNGYFVHYFAPDGLAPTPKNIMFVLDSSGSMYNRKLAQLKVAMRVILEELRPADYFNVMHFAGLFKYWRTDGLVPATPDTIKASQTWVRRIRATGATNINLALEKAMELLGRHANQTATSAAPGNDLIVFLTDGMPTEGVTNIGTILNNVRDGNKQRFTLFSLGFGEGVNFPFLTKLSVQNNGFARKIYEDSDADLQLQGFYREIATPTLSHVQLTYLDDQVDNTTVTQSNYKNYFNGSEIIVSGYLKNPELSVINAQVEANSAAGAWSYSVDASGADRTDAVAPSVEGLENNFERMWAYLTIKNLLQKSIETTSSEEKQTLRQRALQLSLKYNFVTPLTSMVVVKPSDKDDENVDGGEDIDEEAKEMDGSRSPKARDSSSSSVPASSSSRAPSPSRGHRGSFADSDPHFMVGLKGSDTPICFDVMGIAGQIFNLVYDRNLDLQVNGLIVGQKKPSNTNTSKRLKTYFGKIAVFHGNTSVVVTPLKIRVGKDDLPWSPDVTQSKDDVLVMVLSRKKMRLSIGNTIHFVIMRHQVRSDHPVKVSFLGFYIDDDEGLSNEAHGLLGQFKQITVNIDKDILKVAPKSTAKLHFVKASGRPDIQVTAGHRENLAEKEVVPCWFVHNNGRKLLDGRHYDYLVPHLSFRRVPPTLKKKGFLEE